MTTPGEQSKETELKSNLDFTKTKTDHLAVWGIGILGSMRFLTGCVLFFIGWIVWNAHVFKSLTPFDPFPFPILEMLVSTFAIILSVTVLINQNRQGKIEKIRSQVEFEINVRAEHEITRVLSLIHDVHQHMGLQSQEDKELEEMKVVTDIELIRQTVDNQEAENNTFLNL